MIERCSLKGLCHLVAHAQLERANLIFHGPRKIKSINFQSNPVESYYLHGPSVLQTLHMFLYMYIFIRYIRSFLFIVR